MQWDLDPTCYVFPVFWYEFIYLFCDVTVPALNVITQTQRKRSMSGLSPLESNVIGKTSIGKYCPPPPPPPYSPDMSPPDYDLFS